MPTEPTPYYPASTTTLAEGLTAVESVGPQGEVLFWVVDASEPASDPRQLFAPHEETGKLPAAWRRRLGLMCGADTSSGEPCRNLVPRFGAKCQGHTAQAERGRRTQAVNARNRRHPESEALFE